MVDAEVLGSIAEPLCSDDIRLSISGRYSRKGEAFIGIGAKLKALCPDGSSQSLYRGVWNGVPIDDEG